MIYSYWVVRDNHNIISNKIITKSKRGLLRLWVFPFTTTTTNKMKKSLKTLQIQGQQGLFIFLKIKLFKKIGSLNQQLETSLEEQQLREVEKNSGSFSL